MNAIKSTGGGNAMAIVYFNECSNGIFIPALRSKSRICYRMCTAMPIMKFFFLFPAIFFILQITELFSFPPAILR